MAIFVVMGLGEAAGLGKRIKELFPDDHYTIESDKWLVAADRATANSIAIKLGMTEAENVAGLVVTIAGAGYNGLAPGDIWDWIITKATRSGG
jgi:hypothetical protein